MKTDYLGFMTIAGALIAGCQSYWNPEPDFGTSVNSAVRAQLVNPNAPVGNPNVNAHMDGVSAKKTVDNYQKSFDAPRTATSGSGGLITINSGMTSGSTSTGAR